MLLVPPLATGRTPDTSVVRLTALHEGFPAALPWRMVLVVPWLENREEARVGEKYEGVPVAPVLLPKRLLAGALDRAKLKAGVVLGVATEVVNKGLRVPALMEVTVPFVEVAHDGTPPARVRTWPLPPAVRLVGTPATPP